MASPVGLKSPKTAAPAAQKSGLHAMLETRAEPPVKYTLSVTGVTGDDESIFEKAWDAQRFRHEAAEVLQQCGPRVGDKNEGVDQWVNVAATKVEVAFRSQVKSILKAGRTANESERSMLNAWLSERDFSVNKLTAERDQAVRDADEARKAMQAQAELLGRSATEALEKSESNQRLMDDLARAKHDNEDLARRERQLLDSLAQCRLQMEEKEAKYTEMSEYVENALKERTETSLQFEKLREDIQHQTSTFTSWQQHTHDEHTEEVRGLQAEIVNLQNQVLELNEQMMQKEVVLSTAESSKAKLEAAAAVALSQAKNEWNQVEIDLRARLDKLKNVENENRVLQEYASTLLKAYQSHGLQVSRNRPHHEGVTRTWGDIYRYVASTAWGQAAGLKDLGKKMRFPIYQNPEHAFPTRPFSRSRNSDRYFGDDDNTANKEGGADGDKTTQETIRRAATGNAIENSSYRRFNLGKNNSVVSLELSTNVSMPGSPPNPSAENSTRPGDAGAGVTAVQFQEHSNGSREVLSRMRDVWGSMHDRFTQFNGRPNTKGLSMCVQFWETCPTERCPPHRWIRLDVQQRRLDACRQGPQPRCV